MTCNTSAVAVCCANASLRGPVAEEPGVFKGDCGLVGEGLEDRDLGIGDRPDLAPAAADDPDRPALAQDRDAEKRAILDDALQDLAGSGVVIGLGEDIGKLHRLTVEKAAAHRKVAPAGAGRGGETPNFLRAKGC